MLIELSGLLTRRRKSKHAPAPSNDYQRSVSVSTPASVLELELLLIFRFTWLEEWLWLVPVVLDELLWLSTETLTLPPGVLMFWFTEPLAGTGISRPLTVTLVDELLVAWPEVDWSDAAVDSSLVESAFTEEEVEWSD
jgi:hypothetical protein